MAKNVDLSPGGSYQLTLYGNGLDKLGLRALSTGQKSIYNKKAGAKDSVSFKMKVRTNNNPRYLGFRVAHDVQV